jgi:hypothetical protein
MNERISRRQLLKVLAAAASGVGLGKVLGSSPLGRGQELLDKHVYLPLVSKDATSTPTPTAIPTETPTATPTATSTPTSTPTVTATPSGTPSASRVVHIHSGDATFWDFGDDYYGDYVDQAVVNAMVDRGVTELTGAPSVAQAWQILIPNYSPGKAIAIKTNFNNCRWCNTHGDVIDALIHPINGVIRGLLQAYPSFNISDIWIYDATVGKDPPISHRHVPERFKGGCLYPGVRYFDQGCNEIAGYSSGDPSANIAWHNPGDIPTPPSMQVTDVLVGATYLIDMPIMKRHISVITLTFKNHFGSIANPFLLHEWFEPGGPHYGGTTYNPVVDIYCNTNILNKAAVVIGDGLFGNRNNNWSEPTPWTTFGNNAPNSLFFAVDPVAIDCVMCDLLHAEKPLTSAADDYLVYASSLGLGTYERGDPWGSGYAEIELLKIEL